MTDDETSQLLRDIAGDEGAASHQGCLFGWASASPATVASASAWPGQVIADLPDTAHLEDIREALTEAANRCVATLEEGQLDLSLMIADDNSPLSERAEALGQWCQGYLVGLASAGITDFEALPGDVPEFLSDVLAISLAGSDDDDEASEASEASEVAFVELIEYLRVGVQLVYDELTALKPAPTVQ